MGSAAALIAAMNAINALTPLVAELTNSLRQTGETDEQVIERARAMVNETRTITGEDMTDRS
jgi:archaellum component FlaG (FlaF/FlaG flagellin family)